MLTVQNNKWRNKEWDEVPTFEPSRGIQKNGHVKMLSKW